MKTYRSNTPRFTLGLGAVALTALTVGLLAIAPARMDFRSQQVQVIATDALQQAAAASTDPASTAAPVVYSIDVTAARELHLVTVVESLRVQQNHLRG